MKIRQRKLPSGAVGWQLDLGVLGARRVRRSFNTKGEALQALKLAREAKEARGAAAFATDPTTQRWLDRLAADGLTLTDALESFYAARVAVAASKPYQELVAEYLADLTELRRSPSHLRDVRQVLSQFLANSDGIGGITADYAKKYLLSNAFAPATQRRILSTLKTFCTWLVRHKHAVRNPLTGDENYIRLAKPEATEILAFGVTEVRSLLECAQRPEHRSLLGWLALALFAGIRPKEITRLDRNRLNLESGNVRITARASKTSSTRVILLEPIALRMLREWCADVPADAPFEPKGHRKRLERLRDSAGLRKNWPHDVLRHTFATMHYAMFQNRAQLQALMGHSGSENTLFQHYRAVLTVSGETVTARMAEEFWGLTPKRCRPTNPPR